MATESVQSDSAMTAGNMTVDTCLAHCINQTLQFAALSLNECHCWEMMPNATTDLNEVAPHQCGEFCPGNHLELCGGSSGPLKTFAVYDSKMRDLILLLRARFLLITYHPELK